MTIRTMSTTPITMYLVTLSAIAVRLIDASGDSTSDSVIVPITLQPGSPGLEIDDTSAVIPGMQSILLYERCSLAASVTIISILTVPKQRRGGA